MLYELRVRQLGVVEDATLELESGMTAITGETGAGKTMVVEAIRLLTGGRAEARVVRGEASEAVIEGRFDSSNDDEDEQVFVRTVARTGKSRATINDRMVSLATLAEQGDLQVELHGQHSHRSLLAPAAQRHAVDDFGAIDLAPLQEARRNLRDIDAQLAELGGDPQTRAREIDLLRFQLTELDDAALDDPDEEEKLRREETALADAGAHREAVAAAHELLNGDGGIEELLGTALKAVSGREPLKEIESGLRNVVAAAMELAHETGAVIDGLRDDPERLAEINDRRAALKQLLRKYGANLREVMDYREQTRARLEELDRYEEVVDRLLVRRDAAQDSIEREERKVRAERTRVAPQLAKRVEERLHQLALPNARFEVTVGDVGAGDAVEFQLGPNPGMPVLPVAKAASGGELARTMLALRLALMNVPAPKAVSKNSSPAGESAHSSGKVLIFDEVDAGIGGEAAVAVGRALSMLARQSGHQVLVVTHLPQVAAFADNQITVQKETSGAVTASKLIMLSDAEREIELARMLSGRPDSDSGRAHARELLDQATDKPKKSRKKAAS